MNRLNRVALLFVMTALGCTESEPEATEVSAVRNSRVVGRPCRADSFYIDVPVNRTLVWSDTSFLPAFRAFLDQEVNAAGKPWFCGTDQVTCPSGAITVDAHAALPSRSSPSWRADGHLRFFRVEFRSAGGSGTRLTVRPMAWCTAVETIREAFESVTGAGGSDGFFVGRECDASVSGVEGAPDSAMLSWHLDRIGLTSAAVQVTAPAIGSDRVDLGLVDSGVLPAVGTAQGGIGLASEVDEIGTPGLHVHGTALSILARQLAPTAALHSARALDAGGSGTSESLSRALDALIFGGASGASTRPLVLNLSLGWPAELGQPSALTGPSCQTHEDVFGEPIRYLLDVARHMDRAGERPIFVASSAGNLPLTSGPSLFPAAPPGTVTFDPNCGPIPAYGPQLFFPAEWDRMDTCRSGERRTRGTLAVSAVDDQRRRAGISIAGAETPLVAPGQHVYASHPNAPISSTAPICSGASISFPPPITLPVALSGTSVSAALVSGAAARAQSTLLRQNRRPLKRDALARLLYLTGDSICRTAANGAQVRELDVGRLDTALASCASLVECAVRATNDEILPATLLGNCWAHLVECGLEAGDAPTSCPAVEPVEWPSAYLASRATCATRTLTGAFQNAAACNLTCPYETGRYRSLLGSLGPQPDGPICPDCPGMFSVSSGAPTGFLLLELTPKLEPGTIIQAPFLLVQGNGLNGQVVKFYLDLLVGTEPEMWGPGKHLDLQVDLSSLPIDWSAPSAVRAALVAKVTPPGGQPSTDYSPLRIEFD